MVAPITANTLALTVTNVAAGADLRVQIYAAGRPLTTTLPAEIVLGYDVGRGAYTATLPVHLAAFLHLRDANTPAHELVTDFTLGGAPDLALSQSITLTLPPGTVITYTNGVTQTLTQTATLNLGTGALQINNSQATILGEGVVLNLGEGLTLNLGEGLTLSLGEGLTLNLGEGLTLNLGEGLALLVGQGNTLILGDGLTLNLGDGLTLNLGDGLTQILDDGNGPVLSSDGQVVLFVETSAFAPGQFYTLQPATRVPNPPVYATVVGQPYRLAASPGAPAIEGSSLSFRYLGRDVPPGEENFLKVWFYEEGAGTWSPLETTLDTVQNSAAATAQGPGLYVLMSSMEIPLDTAGWNLVSYPVQGSRPITEALASIDGSYSTVYAYRGAADPSHPWPFFDSAVPADINTLATLQFGRGYWIHVSQPITLYLKGAGSTVRGTVSVPLPPATFYGQLIGDGKFTPALGMTVQAHRGDALCATGGTLRIQNSIYYVIQVANSTNGSAPSCGAPGAILTLTIAGLPVQETLLWDDGRVQRQDLTIHHTYELYLPALFE